jgi:hypothetical protein
MADVQSHILDGVMDSHCDCNFFVNIYRWDFPQVAALAAPRPLLIGGTDRDPLFRLPSTLRISEKVRRIYDLYSANDKLGLVLAPGPHDETPELQLGVMRWFNRYLKGEETPVETAAKRFFSPEQLKVFETLPADSINPNIAETFVPAFEQSSSGRESAHSSSPQSQSRLTSAATMPNEKNAGELRSALCEKVFAGWPDEGTPPEPKRVFSVERGGIRFSAWDFTSQHDVPLWFYLLENATAKPTERLELNVLNQSGWTNWLAAVSTKFGSELAGELAANGGGVLRRAAADQQVSPTGSVALAFFAPRGVGLTAWSGGETRLTKIRRRFMLLGQTLDGMRVWDIRCAVQALHSVPGMDAAKIGLQAEGTMAVNALYAALFEPGMHKLDLANLPKSHMQGPDYLNVLKITDIPQVKEAVATRTELKLETQ